MLYFDVLKRIFKWFAHSYAFFSFVSVRCMIFPLACYCTEGPNGENMNSASGHRLRETKRLTTGSNR